MSLLRVESLSKKFGGVNAVDDLSFDIPPGAVYSIIGPNGAGKTTLLNLLTGVYQPSAGRIVFGAHDLTGRAPYEYAGRGIARTFQNLQVFFNMSALENVMVGRYLHERCGLASALLRIAAAFARRARLPRGSCRTDALRRPAGLSVGRRRRHALRRLEAAGDRARARDRTEADAARRTRRRTESDRDDRAGQSDRKAHRTRRYRGAGRSTICGW